MGQSMILRSVICNTKLSGGGGVPKNARAAKCMAWRRATLEADSSGAETSTYSLILVKFTLLY